MSTPATAPPFVRLEPEAPLGLRRAACVAQRAHAVGCDRCAAACPRGVLSVDLDGPTLEQGCDGCGQCAAACPTSALRVPGFAVSVQAEAAEVVLECWRVPTGSAAPDSLRVPCLGGLTPGRLLEIRADAGVRPVTLLDRGYCQDCPSRGDKTHPAAPVLAESHRLLNAIGIPRDRHPQLRIAPLPVERRARSEGFGAEERVSRRAFLSGMMARTLDAADQVYQTGLLQPASEVPGPLRERAVPEERARLLAALHRLGSTAPPARLFPSLAAADACAGHRVCAAVCPTGALFGYSRAERGIAFVAAACVACGACVRVCPEQALVLDREGCDTGPTQARVLTRFATRECPQCGNDFVDADAAQCPACRSDRSFARSAFDTLFARRTP